MKKILIILTITLMINTSYAETSNLSKQYLESLKTENKYIILNKVNQLLTCAAYFQLASANLKVDNNTPENLEASSFYEDTSKSLTPYAYIIGHNYLSADKMITEYKIIMTDMIKSIDKDPTKFPILTSKYLNHCMKVYNNSVTFFELAL